MTNVPTTGPGSFFGGDAWARRGESDARIASLETSRTADETRLALLENQPACRVYNSADTGALTSATKTAIAFDSERFDTDSMHAAGSSTRITFNTAGLYIVTGNLAYSNNATGFRMAIIRLNGTIELANPAVNAVPVSDWTIVGVTTIYRFAVADYVELVGYQTSGGGLVVKATGAFTPEFAAARIGP